MNKVFVGFVVLVFVVGAILTSSMAQAQTIPPGANIKAVVTAFTSPSEGASGTIEITLEYIFADKAGGGISVNGVRAAFDPSGTLASMKTAMVNALIAEATTNGYNLAAADIMLPSYVKGA